MIFTHKKITILPNHSTLCSNFLNSFRKSSILKVIQNTKYSESLNYLFDPSDPDQN